MSDIEWSRKGKTLYHKSNASGTEVAGCLLLVIFAIAAYIAFMPWVVMTLWNVVVPQVFGGPHIDYWTAFAGWLLLGIFGTAFRGFTVKGNHS